MFKGYLQAMLPIISVSLMIASIHVILHVYNLQILWFRIVVDFAGGLFIGLHSRNITTCLLYVILGFSTIGFLVSFFLAIPVYVGVVTETALSNAVIFESVGKFLSDSFFLFPFLTFGGLMGTLVRESF